MLRNGRMKPALLQMVLAALVLAAVPASGQQQPDGLIDVDLQLVLAVDVSGSIDEMEARLQRDGYVQAMRDPFVIQAIGNGPHGRIAVAYTEWAGPLSQTLVVDWHVIDGPATAGVFARRLQEAPVGTGQRTSISSAILHAVPLFRKGGFRAVRKVIDISGDGANNGGFHVHHTRYRALENGITINGLPIMNNRPSPLGLPATDLDRRMRQIEQLFEGSVRQGDTAKAALGTFAEELDRTAEDLARIAGRTEAEAKRGEMARFRVELQEQINAWRQES